MLEVLEQPLKALKLRVMRFYTFDLLNSAVFCFFWKILRRKELFKGEVRSMKNHNNDKDSQYSIIK